MLENIINQYPSVSAFCRAISISPQFYSQIKSGKRPWPPKAVIRLKEIHGVDPASLRPDIFGPAQSHEPAPAEVSE